MESLPLVVIVGPTASGKTGLAIKIAQKYGGEVISADSRAVYKGADIGAAKPSIIEQGGIPHWGIDLIEPGVRFTAADFQGYATQKIVEIRSRGRVPILAGGSGLYVNAVLFDYQFAPEPQPGEREKWEAKSIEELYKYCVENNIQLPENRHNKRYVINTILRNGYSYGAERTPENDIIVGITTDRNVLRQKIQARIEQQFRTGVVDEALSLAKKYGWDNEAMTGNIYRAVRDCVENGMDMSVAIEQCRHRDWQLAKRQLTWFKRNEHIEWLALDEAYTYLAHKLDNLNKL